MGKQLFHFSEDDAIALFEPRPVAVPAPRKPGHDWLNGPLVWAIEAAYSALYLFPRDCPRILMWRTPDTRESDVALYWDNPQNRMVAFIEDSWSKHLNGACLTRYALPLPSFIDLHDAGMHVSKQTVRPSDKVQLTGLPKHLERAGVELKTLENLTSLKAAWASSLHVSGVRLRNAAGWAAA